MASDAQRRIEAEYAVYQIRTALLDLRKNESFISDQEARELEEHRAELEQILMRHRHPILRKRAMLTVVHAND